MQKRFGTESFANTRVFLESSRSLTIDERLEALVMSVELLTRDVEILRGIVATDAQNIRALARIAEIHGGRF